MRRLLCIALVGVFALAAPASAQDTLEAYEIATLGPEHAAEHAAARAAANAEAAATPAPGHAAALPDAPADEVGRWSSETVDLPTWAINAVLLPTGKVALWGRAPTNAANSFIRDNLSEFWIWDPVSGSLNRHDAPGVDLDDDGDLDAPAPLFCSGQSLLADGQLFVAGGNLGNPDWMGGTTVDWRGLDRAYTFDPWSLTWREQPKPQHGRWYPSQVQLADGRIAILAGLDETGAGGAKNIEMEIFTPAAERGGLGTMTYHPAGDRDTGFYPHLFTLPNGKVLLGGPDQSDSALLDPAALDGLVTGSAWTDLPDTNSRRTGGNAVLWPQGAEHDSRVTLLGGFTSAPHGGDAVPDTETFDADAPDDGWTLNGAGIPAMNVGRSYGNVIQLPDGGLVAVGGGAGSHWNEGDANWTAGNQELKRVELLRPGIDDEWTLGPAQQKWRAYHSTALLLPDGRVLSAGDDYWALGDVKRQHAATPMDVGEIYSPPYLFDGDELATRPRIDDAPAAVPYGAPFGVKVSQRDAARAVLVAPGATTHGADMNQRLVVLETLRSSDGEGLDVRAPAGSAAAPQGYYMLFVLDDAGTPSVARWVRVAADAPAPAVLPVPTPTPPPTVTPVPTETAEPTVVPTPSATPVPTPTPMAPPQLDRTAPKATLSLKRRGRRLNLQVKLSEAGRADVELRYGSRRVKRTLTFSRAGTLRTITVTPPRGVRRLTVTIRARDAAGNRRTITRRFATGAPSGTSARRRP